MTNTASLRFQLDEINKNARDNIERFIVSKGYKTSITKSSQLAMNEFVSLSVDRPVLTVVRANGPATVNLRTVEGEDPSQINVQGLCIITDNRFTSIDVVSNSDTAIRVSINVYMDDTVPPIDSSQLLMDIAAAANILTEAKEARDAILNMQVATGDPGTDALWDGETLTIPRGDKGDSVSITNVTTQQAFEDAVAGPLDLIVLL